MQSLVDLGLPIALVSLTALAAAAWFKSATARVAGELDSDGKPIKFLFALDDDADLDQPATIVVNGADIIRTMVAQAFWNRIAAGLACAAATVQVISYFRP